MTPEEYSFLTEDIGYFHWYWKAKAKYVKKFTFYDIMRFITFNMDSSDVEALKRYFRADDNIVKLYGQHGETHAPGTYKYTTWQLISMTYTWISYLGNDIFLWKMGLKMIYSWEYHFERMQVLLDAWLNHYLIMYHLDDPSIYPDTDYPYSEELPDDPWWLPEDYSEELSDRPWWYL